MGKPLKVLIVEDRPKDAELLVLELRRGGMDPDWLRVDTAEAMIEALEDPGWDVVLSDYQMPRFSGPKALEILRERSLDLPFIMVSGTVGEEIAVEAMRVGAHDFMAKDRLARLVPAIERELREVELRRERRKMEDQLFVSDRMASLGVLAAGVAHEINNPLAALIANLDFIAQDLSRLKRLRPAAVDEKADGGGSEVLLASHLSGVDESLRDAREAADRVRLIVRDLKVFSRSGDEENTSAVQVTRALDSCARMAFNEIRHRARLVKDYSVDLPAVEANEARLGQVFLNLLVNAAQAIPEGMAERNEIRVSTRASGDDFVSIDVRDTGAGMPPDVVARIFDPFFTTKPVGVGTGLGLAICHKIVSGFGGRISVESRPGRGTTFRVHLPISRREVSTSEPQPTPAPAGGRRGRILIVDDEVLMAKAIARALSPEHDVDEVNAAQEASARILQGERYDVILCDMMMPSMTGMDLHAELARTSPEQASRMVFMTGGAFTESAREFLERVPHPRLEKPFENQNLRALIRSILG